jgi:hypothetical protein
MKSTQLCNDINYVDAWKKNIHKQTAREYIACWIYNLLMKIDKINKSFSQYETDYCHNGAGFQDTYERYIGHSGKFTNSHYGDGIGNAFGTINFGKIELTTHLDAADEKWTLVLTRKRKRLK